MTTDLRTALTALLTVILLSGCDGVTDLANTQQQDTTSPSAFADADEENASLLSAFYGLDDAIPFFASYRICGEFGHKDGMPVIFSEELDLATMQAGDFLVHLTDGSQVRPGCVTPAPANDEGELRTMLMVGDFGSISNEPVVVEITGNLVSMDHQLNYRNSTVDVTPLASGPTLVYAEIVSPDQWELGKEATGLPFGGGNGCPEGTAQIVRAVWAGGVTKPGGDEIDNLEMSAYRVHVEREDGTSSQITPFTVADLGDGDNNHLLCLDVATPVVRIEFPEGLLTDPREDLNPATAISIRP